MTREQAIEIVKTQYPHDHVMKTALGLLIPELRESEDDEEIYREIYTIVHHSYQERAELLINPNRKKELLNRWEKAKAYLEKQKEQKPDWSDEDEKELDCIINVLDRLGFEEFCKSSRDQDNEEERFYYKEIQFLKRLKSIRPQPKQEWSEEDEKRIKQLIYDTEAIRAGYEKRKEKLGDEFNNELIRDCDAQIAWLKSLRPSWKPSKEDIKMLEHIIGQYETGNKNSKVMGYLPRVEELSFLKKVLSKWKN